MQFDECKLLNQTKNAKNTKMKKSLCRLQIQFNKLRQFKMKMKYNLKIEKKKN